MKTSIEIDEQLLTQAQALTQAKSKEEVIDLALQRLIQTLRRQQMLHLRGNVQWDGNLDEMRAV